MTKQTTTVVPSVVSCATESSSPLNETCEKNRTPLSPTARHRSNKKKKIKQNAKLGKEEDKNFGEQLLKEFADFQSTRPDKICVQEKTDSYKSPNRCEVPDETSLGLPLEEGRTKGQESSNDVEKRLNEESVPTADTRQETISPSPPNTDKHQALELSADTGTTITDEHIDRSSLEVDRRFQSDTDPNTIPLTSEPLPVTPYTNETNRDKTEKEPEYENKSSAIVINSTPTWPVRSNTIPGLQPSPAGVDEDTYTITELAPVKPLDLTSLVSSLCETEEPDINYSNSYPNDPQASVMPGCLSSQVHNYSIWDSSTDVTALSHVQEGTEALGKGGGQAEGYTIMLPPVATKKEADEQVLALFNESQISEYYVLVCSVYVYVCTSGYGRVASIKYFLFDVFHLPFAPRSK